MDYFVQLADGLSHIHAKKVLHRDLKPENIFVYAGHGDERVLKIGDLGIARCLTTSIELAQTVVGSPTYISPEIIHGARQVPLGLAHQEQDVGLRVRDGHGLQQVHAPVANPAHEDARDGVRSTPRQRRLRPGDARCLGRRFIPAVRLARLLHRLPHLSKI